MDSNELIEMRDFCKRCGCDIKMPQEMVIKICKSCMVPKESWQVMNDMFDFVEDILGDQVQQEDKK